MHTIKKMINMDKYDEAYSTGEQLKVVMNKVEELEDDLLFEEELEKKKIVTDLSSEIKSKLEKYNNLKPFW